MWHSGCQLNMLLTHVPSLLCTFVSMFCEAIYGSSWSPVTLFTEWDCVPCFFRLLDLMCCELYTFAHVQITWGSDTKCVFTRSHSQEQSLQSLSYLSTLMPSLDAGPLPHNTEYHSVCVIIIIITIFFLANVIGKAIRQVLRQAFI